jgi:hypothetical protein
MTRKIGIVSVCHGVGLAHAARLLLPDYEVYELPVWHLRTVEQRQAALERLAPMDWVFLVPLGPEFGVFAADKIAASLSNVIPFPPFVFFGFHPDMTSLPDPYRSRFPAPIADYHSKLAITGFVTGRSVSQTLGLLNPLVFGKLGYFDAFNQEIAATVSMFRLYHMDIAPCFARWREFGCFMHTPNHPMPLVLSDLMRIALATAGIPSDPAANLDGIPDELANHSRAPVYPSIAARLGVPGSTDFSPVRSPDAQSAPVMPAAEFIQACFQIYTQVPPRALLEASGVERARTMLAA